MPESYDIIIVGGGTAGLVLAARLSENADLQVVVIEAGEDQTANPQALTPGMWPLLTNSAADWAFRTAPQEHLGGKELPFSQGHALGGSSTTNSFLFTPTSKSHIEAWAQLGNERWSWQAFNEATRRAVTLHRADGSVEGDGPVQLTLSDPESKWTRVWTDSLGSLGFGVCDAFSGNVSGSVVVLESIDPVKRQRSSSASTYLATAGARTNLTVLTGSAVTKVLLDKSSPEVIATGVEFTKGGETRSIKARKEVILAAGPINSPRLLELSGIGGSDLLQGLGIDVVIDNPHVGENLQNHSLTGLNFDVRDDEETLDPLLRSDPTAIGDAMESYGKGVGPLSTSNTVTTAQMPLPAQGAELDKLLQSYKGPDDGQTTQAFAAAHESYVRSVLADPKEASAAYISAPAYAAFDADPTYRAPGNHYTVGVLLSHPLSRGSVHITSASPSHAGSNTGLAIDPRYLSHPLDTEVLARHLVFVDQAIGGAEPLASRLKPREARFADLDAARDYVRRTARGAHHFVGTCSMMPREMGGVVDARLRVHGCANLRVCDSSVVAISPRANSQATVYGVAEMGASLIKESLR